MSYATEYIASTLRAAREAMGLSQRELSAKSGLPQSHISKIENGAVDLRVSSLVALARILNLELALVPRKSIAAVQAVARSATTGRFVTTQKAAKELEGLQNALSTLPADRLPESELAQNERQIRELGHFRLAAPDLDLIRTAQKTVRAFAEDPGMLNAMREAVTQVRSLRNALAHGRPHDEEAETVRPAYSLEEDDHG